MYKVNVDGKLTVFMLLDLAIEWVKKHSGLYFYIYDDDGIILTQDDIIFQELEHKIL